ncbi:hypothetical protein NUW58_g4369 [Xylaria curta]|uniref:Uncharacterized protein n=1 Tax=Xylaria curta TaxID=42375 RepID=A0ACC1P7K6_9PEZI|nr:hypothetical protein NUW58_g4369 [Xylaria curta]
MWAILGDPAPSATSQTQASQSIGSSVLAALHIHNSPMVAMEWDNKQARENGIGTATQNGVVATFIVLGEPDAIEGLTKAIYDDLKDGNKYANIEYRETRAPYIRVDAPTEEDALSLIRTAQQRAGAHLEGRSVEDKIIFFEPPTNYMSNFQVAVHVTDSNGFARHTLESMPDEPEQALKSSSDKYKREFSEGLCKAFENASNLHGSLILKAHLGAYHLLEYKRGKFTLEQFESMVRNPRATGRLETRLGKAPSAEGLSVEAVLRLIQAPDSPCVPIDNQTPTSAHVTPTYVFESWHDGDRYETEIDIIKKRQGPTNGILKFSLVRPKIVPKSAQAPRFEAVSISIGRNVDWKITALPGDEKGRVSPAVKQYLEMGQATLQGSPSDLHSYPAVRLPENFALATKLKSVATKSVYRFSWKGSGYIVQFTINRRWSSIHDMHRQPPTETDFDLTIYADNWDEDSRVRAGETVRKIWGSDLGGLLRDEDATGCALSRVQGLINTMLDIRDFFDDSSHT